MGRRNYTGLFSGEPSFWEGFARVLDVGGTFDSFDEHVSTPEDAYLALAADWYAVGADLHHAINGEATRLHGGWLGQNAQCHPSPRLETLCVAPVPLA